MKFKIVFICSVLFHINLYCQDSTLISNEKLIEIAEKQNYYKRQDSLHNMLMLEQDSKIYNLTKLIQRDSIEISLLNLQLDSQQKIIAILQPGYKKKWYESKFIYYILGATTMYFASELVSNIR
mgnify:CR=1 FL=1